MQLVLSRLSEIVPGPDNPSGRMSAQYVALVHALRDPRSNLGEDTLAQIGSLITAGKRRDLTRTVASASTVAEISGAIRTALGLTAPTEPMNAGIRRLASRLLEAEAIRLDGQIAIRRSRLVAIQGELSH